MAPGALERLRAAVLVSNAGVADSESTVAVDTPRAEGAAVEIIVPRDGQVQRF